MARADQDNNVSAIDPMLLSELVGAVYDCTIEPCGWLRTMAMIGEATRCCSGMMIMSGVDPPTVHLLDAWNLDPEILSEFRSEIAGSWISLPDFWTRDLDRPFSLTQEAPRVVGSTRWIQEKLPSRGYIDSIHLILMRQIDRFAVFSLYRHESEEMVTDRDRHILHVLAPHLRRAIAISDLIDMKNLENAAFGETLDNVAAGVVIVGPTGRILHTNEPARAMLASRLPIISQGGKIGARHPDATTKLLRAIELAHGDETGIGRKGTAVPLVHGGSTAATAHVLPLARSTRTRLVADATAAVFVVAADTPSRVDMGTVARMFGLTPAETRMLAHLSSGESLTNAAHSLGIGITTAKTHRTRIFAKMGVARHAELMALVQRLVPPSL
ncbi:helix-turn-helix transcriptional regulator [Mesorhizobium sp. M1B.F.Ca.ET.045.04.1.1]|uniref:helix-turn-helix transcriptional regulator n=1 Tax=Mesorhizobium sp. M1B.F.Ca.ET.045.04.1.1 TaxID=2493673 RepID=UPI000F755EA5|nr:helix-turn-helix transcriptional regulator [Mesorhizobium sp. M1B.F.Ca.ET.045.04.1.1]AZO32327.1 helix-turn-helix transcriptional regulator [Mesorhizobium sp. M1B.F.Ca.ET.045.04.1.1]